MMTSHCWTRSLLVTLLTLAGVLPSRLAAEERAADSLPAPIARTAQSGGIAVFPDGDDLAAAIALAHHPPMAGLRPDHDRAE